MAFIVMRMGTRDPRIDAYIEKSQPFAQPILAHLREVIHSACPDVVETIKWSMPSFEHHGILCGFAAFKQHCTFGFWKQEIVAESEADRTAMGQFGRITSVKELPSKRVLVSYIRKAAKLNEAGVAGPRARKRVAKPVEVPAELSAALRRNKRAAETFRSFSPSQQREYAEWITEAKRAETKSRRIEQAIEMLEEGKTRNWKYERTK